MKTIKEIKAEMTSAILGNEELSLALDLDQGKEETSERFRRYCLEPNNGIMRKLWRSD